MVPRRSWPTRCAISTIPCFLAGPVCEIRFIVYLQYRSSVLNYIVRCTIFNPGDSFTPGTGHRMKIATYLALGAALISLDALQATYAENTTYFPAGQSQPQITSTVTREQVKTEALMTTQAPRTTWTEFGAGSHDQKACRPKRAPRSTARPKRSSIRSNAATSITDRFFSPLPKH